MSTPAKSFKILATYGIGRNTNLSVSVAKGSVVDFVCPKQGAIVNAANEGCLGGGGVDGAITAAGGRTLARDRLALPLVAPSSSSESSDEADMPMDVRCPTGSAVITGPGDYGELKVPFVIHAVGPNYHMFDGFDTADRLLRSAYQASLDQCRKNDIVEVAFALLSAGVFRGRRQPEDILRIGVGAIRDWSIKTAEQEPAKSSLRSVTLCGFSDQEINLLLDVCELELSK